ncbi:hypothetical protein HZC27_05670 [Candidatus Roizmanbacteria bacterium]|nr:hypothetical protein [Candidatus Roizmanbacteria bacterium]
MKILKNIGNKIQFAFIPFAVYAANVSQNADVATNFQIPSLPDMISFLIKMFFFIAGMAALLYLLMGAFAWVTSSGDKENVKKAQDKIQAAVIGLVIIVFVLAIMVTLEQFVFNKKFCLGISCPVNFSSYVLLK